MRSTKPAPHHSSTPPQGTASEDPEAVRRSPSSSWRPPRIHNTSSAPPLSYEAAENYAAQIRPSWADSLRPTRPPPDEPPAEDSRDFLWGHPLRRRLQGMPRGRFLGLLAAAALAGVLFAIMLRDPEPTAAPPKGSHPPKPATRPYPADRAGPATAVAVAATAAPRATGGVSAAESHSPAPVRVRITTAPAEAEIWLEGRPVQNPYQGPLPTGRALQLNIRAPSGEPHRESLGIGLQILQDQDELPAQGAGSGN